MMGCKRSLVSVALDDFNLSVPKASIQCVTPCIFSQAVDTFVQARMKVRVRNYDGAQHTVVDAEAQ